MFLLGIMNIHAFTVNASQTNTLVYTLKGGVCTMCAAFEKKEIGHYW